jgi:hypothetical protein
LLPQDIHKEFKFVAAANKQRQPAFDAFVSLPFESSTPQSLKSSADFRRFFALAQNRRRKRR